MRSSVGRDAFDVECGLCRQVQDAAVQWVSNPSYFDISDQERGRVSLLERKPYANAKPVFGSKIWLFRGTVKTSPLYVKMRCNTLLYSFVPFPMKGNLKRGTGKADGHHILWDILCLHPPTQEKSATVEQWRCGHNSLKSRHPRASSSTFARAWGQTPDCIVCSGPRAPGGATRAGSGFHFPAGKPCLLSEMEGAAGHLANFSPSRSREFSVDRLSSPNKLAAIF